MLNKIEEIKRKLDEAIKTVCDAIGIFSVHPERDFTRERILTPDKLLWFLLSMEGGVLGTEMLNHFGCSVTTPSPSAFVQQRAKIGPDMLPALLPWLTFPGVSGIPEVFLPRNTANNMQKRNDRL